jgi:integrase/recombinase XerD
MTANTNIQSKGNKRGRPAGVGGGQAPALTPEQVKILLRVTASDPQNGIRNLALLHMCLTGLRVAEPLMLTRQQVTTSDGSVAESFVLGNWTKGKQARRCYLTASARKSLQNWLDIQPNQNPDAKIFDLTPNYAVTLVKHLLRNAGLKECSSHSLRRSAATSLLSSGVDVKTIMLVLGHKNLSTTSAYLARSTTEVQKAVVNNLPW